MSLTAFFVFIENNCNFCFWKTYIILYKQNIMLGVIMEAKEAFNASFNEEWVYNLFDANIADSSDPIPMEAFKRFLKCRVEDGDYFRACTCIQGLVRKLYDIEQHVEDGFDRIESKL